MESKTVNQMKAGDRLEGFYIIKTSECKISSNNKKYMDFTLGDKTGEINSKLWDYKEGDENIYTVNMLIKIRGTVIEWMGNLQLRIDKIRLSSSDDSVNVEDYVVSAPYDPEYMFKEIVSYKDRIVNNEIRSITEVIINDSKDELMHYPAAKKNHHAIRSGLMYHMLTMLRAGEKMGEIYTFLNKDLLYGGIILHDMAKIEEMDASNLGIVSDYTVEGQLLGHITQGVKLIENAADTVGASKEITMLLQHMVLSHHYEPEYGSPVKPMIPEAEMLHYLDTIDARMYDMRKALEDTKVGAFSDRIWSLENRKVYKPVFDSQE